MAAYLIEMFGVSLVFTIIIELVVTVILGFRRWNSILLVVLVNILTNPPAVLVCWICSLYLPHIPELLVQIIVEIIVIAVEAGLYMMYKQKLKGQVLHAVFLSLTANLCSWLFGVWIL